MKTIRIGNGQGFWGDNVDAPVELLRGGPVDYIGMDYLAEVTLSIMMRQKLKNPRLGYATDFIDFIRRVLPELDVAHLQVHSDRPLPQADCRKGTTRYDAVFGKLTADGMCVSGIPMLYRPALLKAAESYLKHRPALAAASRLVVRGIDASTCGVWRVPKGDAQEGSAQGAQPIKPAAPRMRRTA